MKTLQTPYGLLAADEYDDKRMVAAIERGGYPAQEDIHLLLGFIDQGSIVADIGANIGTFTLPFARAAREVHSFEPVPRNLVLLRKNVEQNALTNVRVHDCALGAEEGHTSFSQETVQNAGTYRAVAGGEIEVKTLDNLGLDFDVIKMDVQGMEGRILMGATRVLQTRPILFFEMSGRMREYGPSLGTLKKILRGYTLYVDIGHGWGRVSSPRVALALMSPGVYFFGRAGRDFDILALPRGKTFVASGYVTTFVRLVAHTIRRKISI
ncbi:MAG: FkbM family methyltransferase [bacterium]|nr:FkbM family methyltransferase [bacterium]